MKKHKHIDEYQTEIRKIKKTIMKYCIDSNCYIVGYSNIDHSKTESDLMHMNTFDEIMYYFTDVFDSRMFFEFASITHHHLAYFSIANSYKKLEESFEAMMALFLYERHNFTIMIPVRADYQGMMQRKELMEK